MTNFSMMVSALKQNIARAVVGKDDVVELMLTALLCEGHVLIEDVPGVGKTTLASALARSLSCSFKRIQFTPDITPSDITGFTMPSLSGEMQYRPGAIMSQIVLADEINRTSPKTQSALLEVMEERQVTVDGVTYPLARPFMVLATQNPVDFVGTYPLPEAQMDRFFMRISIGYPSMQDEMDILDRYCGEQKPMESVVPVCSSEDVIAMQQEVKTVYCSKEVRAYIAAICAAPMVLGRRGLLSGREAVCFPGFEHELTGAHLSDRRVVKDGKIITGVGMGAALEFGLALVEVFCGKETADKLGGSVLAK